MKQLLIALSAICITYVGTALASSALHDSGGLNSLRGATPVATQEKTDALKKRQKDQRSDVYRRAHKDNPPMIPHDSQRYWITADKNKCLDCHEQRIAKRKKATPLPDSHYQDRDGKVYKKAAKRRYFCRQCHAEQVDAPPLIVNEY